MNSHAPTDTTPDGVSPEPPADSSEQQGRQRGRINSLLGYIILLMIAGWVLWMGLMIVDSLFGLGWFDRSPTELPPR